MGDTRVKDKAPDSTDRNQEGASQALRDDAYGTYDWGGQDKTRDTGATTAKRTYDDPYAHTAMAGAAIRELDSLKDKNQTDKVRVPDSDGQVREITVNQRRAELLQAADSEFQKGVSAADRIKQDAVRDTDFRTRTEMSNFPKESDRTPEQVKRFNELADFEKELDKMKHAPSVSRTLYATFLADNGDLVKAKQMLDQASGLDSEAKNNAVFKQISDQVNGALSGAQDRATDGQNPFLTLKAADDKRKAGDVAGAEALYKQAVDQADKLDPTAIGQGLKAIADERKTPNLAPERAKQLNDDEQALTSLAHAQSVARMNYADFLNEQKRYDEAVPLLTTAQGDPLMASNPEFMQMLEKARNKGKDPEPFVNPYDCLQKFQEAYKAGNLDEARNQVEAAVKAADKVDRKAMEQGIKTIEAQLKTETDSEVRKTLEANKQRLEALDHAAGFARYSLGVLELASKNYDTAHKLFEEVQQKDPELAGKPELRLSEMLDSAKEPSTWQKVWGFAKGILKELACDAVAILAGAGAAIATGWSGPGAIAVGAVAGAAAYTAMKGVMGIGERMYDGQDFVSAAKGTWKDDIHWYTPIWGALDGASGGAAAAARTALVSVGGKIVTQEAAADAIAATTKGVATGAASEAIAARLATIEGMEGMKMAQTAETVAKQGLKEMGKDLSLWTRVQSSVPFINAGNAEYRSAIAAYRGLKYTNMGARAMVDGGTALTMSAVNRAGHEAFKEDFSGFKYNSFGDFAKAYGTGVTKDTLTGMSLGAYSVGFGKGVLMSSITNAGKEAAFGNHSTFGDYTRAWAMGVGADSMVGMVGGSVFGGKPAKWIGSGINRPGFATGLDSSWVAASPRAFEVYQQYGQVEQAQARLKDLQAPPANNDEVQRRLFQYGAPSEYPRTPIGDSNTDSNTNSNSNSGSDSNNYYDWGQSQ